MFNITRFFSIVAAIGVVIVILILSLFFRHLSEQNLMQNQTLANVNMTYSFANSSWEKVSDFIERSQEISSREELLKQPEIDLLHNFIKDKMKGTNVVKVKIYNLNGLTVFSTEKSQIGDDKSNSKGFLKANSGEVVSDISFRNEFNSLENMISDRNLVTTYIPIKQPPSNQIKAVFEVYSDVTDLVNGIEKNQLIISTSVSTALIIFYIFLFLIVRHAHKTIIDYDLERVQKEKDIAFLAYHDSLTGLLNRASFNEKIQEIRARLKRHASLTAILFIDLDRFKSINDNLGHDAGDKLLCCAALAIKNSVRDTDYAFRLSGDEFLVILEDLENTNEAYTVAKKIQETAQKPTTISGHELSIKMSIGITVFSNKEFSSDIEAMVNQADLAMYRAKQSGPGNIVFFSPTMKNDSLNSFTLETELNSAVLNDEFIPYFQAKVNPNNFELSSVEVLLRWNHKKKGIIPPNSFIPLLEESGLICQVTENLIKQVCDIAHRWENNMKPTRVSINISALQFKRSNFIDVIENALNDSSLSPHLLELELTESLLIKGSKDTKIMLNALKKLGVKLSIDDFGKGYSSLSYLKQLPVDFLKIDKGFIKEIHKDDRDLSITKSICSLSHSLNMKTIAEGIETKEQAAIVQKIGCDELQGFFFCKPIPLQEFEDKYKLNKTPSHN